MNFNLGRAALRRLRIDERGLAVEMWTVGCADTRLTARTRFPMDKSWKTLRVYHRLPTGRRLSTSPTAQQSVLSCNIQKGRSQKLSTPSSSRTRRQLKRPLSHAQDLRVSVSF